MQISARIHAGKEIEMNRKHPRNVGPTPTSTDGSPRPARLEFVVAADRTLGLTAHPRRCVLGSADAGKINAVRIPAEVPAQIAWHLTRRLRDAADEAVYAVGCVKETARVWANASPAQVEGRIFEEVLVGSFNRNAVLAGSNERGFTMASRRMPHAKADVGTSRGVLAQVKRYNLSQSTATALSREGYEGLQKIGPADQLDGMRAHAARRGADLALRSPARSARMRDTALRVNDRLVGKTAESEGFSTAELRRISADPRRLARPAVVAETLQAAKVGFVAGVVVQGVVSIATHVSAISGGRLAVREAAWAVGKDIITGGMIGAIISGGATLLRRAAPSLGRGFAPVAIVATALDLCKSGMDLARGRISGRAFFVQSGESIVLGAAAWAGAEGGAAIGTALLPGPGTVIGGVVGGLGAWGGARALLNARRPADCSRGSTAPALPSLAAGVKQGVSAVSSVVGGLLSVIWSCCAWIFSAIGSLFTGTPTMMPFPRLTY